MVKHQSTRNKALADGVRAFLTDFPKLEGALNALR